MEEVLYNMCENYLDNLAADWTGPNDETFERMLEAAEEYFWNNTDEFF